MSPLRELRSWTTRYEEEISIDPLRRYYLIFEGANTEKQYFKGVDTYRKELGINNLIEMVILSKEGEIRDYSHPSKLLALIQQKKENSLSLDRMIKRSISSSLCLTVTVLKRKKPTWSLYS